MFAYNVPKRRKLRGGERKPKVNGSERDLVQLEYFIMCQQQESGISEVEESDQGIFEK